MARVTVEDCLKRIPNRFFLVHAATKRVRQLREGSERLIDAPENEDIVTALREIAAGKVFVTRHYTDYEEPAEDIGEETAAEPSESTAAAASGTAEGEPAEAPAALSAEDPAEASEVSAETSDETPGEAPPDEAGDDAAGDVDEAPGNQADDDPNN